MNLNKMNKEGCEGGTVLWYAQKQPIASQCYAFTHYSKH